MKEGTGELFYGALLTGIKKLAPSDIPLEASWICAAKSYPLIGKIPASEWNLFMLLFIYVPHQSNKEYL